jgi:hypothetical protein
VKLFITAAVFAFCFLVGRKLNKTVQRLMMWISLAQVPLYLGVEIYLFDKGFMLQALYAWVLAALNLLFAYNSARQLR